MYDMLLSPKAIGKLKLKNRTVMTAAEMSLGQLDGKPTERMIRYYEERARGGVALIIPGICRVNDMGATSSFTQLSMASDENIVPMRMFADRIHDCDSKLCIQLHHPGRQGYASSINIIPLLKPVVKLFPRLLEGLFKLTPLLLSMEQRGMCQSVQAPSKYELSKHGATRIHAMTRREIKNLINDFVDAAYRCYLAGVDAVELHGGHGYLIQQFISPNTNHRTDEYGGSFENRMRFVTEIILGIKQRCSKDFPIIVRMSADECYDRIGQDGKGYGLDYGISVAKLLEAVGADALNVTCACYDTYNYWLEPTSFDEGWRSHMAKQIKKNVSIPVIAVGVIRTPKQAEQQLMEGCQDFIGSARSFFCEPNWVSKLRQGKENEIRRCIGCLHCISSFMTNAKKGLPGECALNPRLGREAEQLKDNGYGRRVVVVGAGPAGLSSANTLAQRGFKIILLEKSAIAGGQVITAANCTKKHKLYWCIEDALQILKANGADIRFGFDATADSIMQFEPWAVILATGGEPIRPKTINGITRKEVLTAPFIIDYYKQNKSLPKVVGKNVVVVGSGMTGLAVSEILSNCNCNVTVIEMAKEIAPTAWFQLVDDEMSRIKTDRFAFKALTRLVAIDQGRVLVEDTKLRNQYSINTDSVVLAMGVCSKSTLASDLAERVERIITVGDAKSSGTIAGAVHSGYNAAAGLE